MGKEKVLEKNYYDNGKLESEGYKNEHNVWIGEWKYYRESGELSKIVNYINSNMETETKEFYKSGELKFTSSFKYPNLDIFGTNYFKSGKKKNECKLINYTGKWTIIKEWDEDGNQVINNSKETNLNLDEYISFKDWWDNNSLKVSNQIKSIIDEEIDDFRTDFQNGEFDNEIVIQDPKNWDCITTSIVSQNLGILGNRINSYIDSICDKEWDDEDETYIKFEEEFLDLIQTYPENKQ